MPAELIPALMAALGLATHYLKDLARISVETGRPPALVRYWSRYPYQTLLSMVGAAAGYFALHEMGQLSGMTAFGAGYMANSMADILGKRTVSKMGGDAS